MPYPTPQATGIPNSASLGDEIRSLNRAKRSDINSPRVVTLTGNSDIVFDARSSSTLGDQQPVRKLTLHNLGANKMYYAMNQACGSTVGTYHDILAGGSAVLDGLGSLVDLSNDQPQFVTVKGTAGELIAVVISYPADQPRIG